MVSQTASNIALINQATPFKAILLNAANLKDYSIELSKVDKDDISLYDLRCQWQIFATSINAQSDNKPFT